MWSGTRLNLQTIFSIWPQNSLQIGKREKRVMMITCWLVQFSKLWMHASLLHMSGVHSKQKSFQKVAILLLVFFINPFIRNFSRGLKTWNANFLLILACQSKQKTFAITLDLYYLGIKICHFFGWEIHSLCSGL